jgi:hypothetical protein
MALLTLLASHDHGWFWLWPLVPLFWFLVVFLFVCLFFWRDRRGPWTGYAMRDQMRVRSSLSVMRAARSPTTSTANGSAISSPKPP